MAAACVAGRSEAWPISERVAAGKACRTAPRWSTIQRRRRRLRTKRPRRLFSVYAAPPEEDVTKKAEAARARGESCLRCHRTDYKFTYSVTDKGISFYNMEAKGNVLKVGDPLGVLLYVYKEPR